MVLCSETVPEAVLQFLVDEDRGVGGRVDFELELVTVLFRLVGFGCEGRHVFFDLNQFELSLPTKPLLLLHPIINNNKSARRGAGTLVLPSEKSPVEEVQFHHGLVRPRLLQNTIQHSLLGTLNVQKIVTRLLSPPLPLHRLANLGC